MDELDRAIVNRLQGGFPLSPRPFAEAAKPLLLEEEQLLDRLRRLLDQGVLTRFGPMYDMERLGGVFTLCAMAVPARELDRVAALVNAHPEVAHNYERAHRFNLWFVVAAGASRTQEVVRAIEAETGLGVMPLPREAGYFVELRLFA